MEQKKIYPYIIDEGRMAGYYELLLEDKFKLKIFDKKKDSKIYENIEKEGIVIYEKKI